jgi:hypothetical protein
MWRTRASSGSLTAADLNSTFESGHTLSVSQGRHVLRMNAPLAGLFGSEVEQLEARRQTGVLSTTSVREWQGSATYLSGS